MKTARTCEEYILNTLEKAKKEITLDNEIIEKQMIIISHLMDILGVFKKNLELRKDSEGKEIIMMNFIFEAYDPADFSLLHSFFFSGEKEEEGEKEEGEALC